MKNKLFITLLFGVALVSFLTAILILQITKTTPNKLQAESIQIKPVSSDILSHGEVHSENEATVHFQTGGKLVYVGKEGDKVYQGQTIAQLDTYPLQKQLTLALNTYRSTRDSFDQTQQNSQTGELQGSQRYSLNVLNQSGITGDQQNNIIADMAKRIVDQNQANLDNSVITVELANYALQLATLSSPINGVITHEDVNVAYQNVTSTTSFSVADPTTPVFRANVSDADIDFVSVGAIATVTIDGSSTHLSGTVTKIYPQKITLSTGQQVYPVDIHLNGTQPVTLGQNGSVLIQRNTTSASILVPTWAIIGHTHMWVLRNNKPTYITISTGKMYADKTEILDGLQENDRVITNPKSLGQLIYPLL